MIERYSRDEMKKIWDLNSKFQYYLNVELAVCKAYNRLGKIPDSALNEIVLFKNLFGLFTTVNGETDKQLFMVVLFIVFVFVATGSALIVVADINVQTSKIAQK